MFKKLFECVDTLKSKFNAFASKPEIKELFSLRGAFGVAADTLKDMAKRPVKQVAAIALALVVPGGLPVYITYRAKKWYDARQVANDNIAQSAALRDEQKTGQPKNRSL